MTSRLGGSGSAGVEADRRVVIGMTGPIAAGKSTVAEMLRERGADVIDADQVYRSLLAPGSPLSRAIVDRFGPAVCHDDGIDRAALGAIVFENPTALADLERLTHPAVVAEVRRRIANSPAAVVVVEAVKLVQSGLLADVDSLWLVTAQPEVRLQRLMRHRGLDEATARARIAASSQVVPWHVPVDVEIDNSESRAATARAVDVAWERDWKPGVTPRGSHRETPGTLSREEGA